ncbi:MAG TPA: hypothetical protein VFU81_13085 [Thermomicrobiales bacterium]|nr:hypothetical protein [Thermomicrobiales bacterium]
MDGAPTDLQPIEANGFDPGATEKEVARRGRAVPRREAESPIANDRDATSSHGAAPA